MATYEDVFFTGVLWTLVALVPIVFIILGWLVMRHHRRNWVWVDLELKGGRVVRKLVKPPKDGFLTTKKWGTFTVEDRAMRIYKGRPLYRYAEDVLFPIAYDRSRQVMTFQEDTKDHKKGDQIIAEIANPIAVTPSSPRISAYLRDQTHAQVYGKNATMELLLIVIAVLVVIAILVSAAK